MKDVYRCVSCGFVSTHGSSYEIIKEKQVCKECIEEYGKDPSVTRWMDAAGVGEKRNEIVQMD